jgi:hypothetical protein
MRQHLPTTGSDYANSRGKHRPGPGRIDVLCLGVVLANGHTSHALIRGTAAPFAAVGASA